MNIAEIFRRFVWSCNTATGFRAIHDTRRKELRNRSAWKLCSEPVRSEWARTMCCPNTSASEIGTRNFAHLVSFSGYVKDTQYRSRLVILPSN